MTISTTRAQVMETGDLEARLSTIISNMPGNTGDDYQLPTAGELTQWEDMLTDLFAGNYGDAATKATTLGYDLVEFTDNTDSPSVTYYLLETTSGGSNYWGTYVYNPNACRSNLIIQAPHPKFDFNTGKQGIYIFRNAEAGLFCMSGTHRCNNGTASSCSGTTSVCGASAPYRISDMAHVVDAVFHKTTEKAAATFPTATFVQLHGFSMGASDPYVIMSNGSRDTPSPDDLLTLRDQLLVEDPFLTFKIGHVDMSWNRLLGFTNTQGRHLNGVGTACTGSALSTTGRFMHLEQEKTRLRDNETGWTKMSNALINTFPAGGCLFLPVELDYFRVRMLQKQALIEWATLSESNSNYFAVEKSADGKQFRTLTIQEAQGNSEIKQTYSARDFPLTGNNYYRLKQVDLDGKTTFSPIKHLFFQPQLPLVYHSENQLFFHNLPQLKSIHLFNSTGQLVFFQILEEGQYQIPLPPLPPGVYAYSLKYAHESINGKIVFRE